MNEILIPDNVTFLHQELLSGIDDLLSFIGYRSINFNKIADFFLISVGTSRCK